MTDSAIGDEMHEPELREQGRAVVLVWTKLLGNKTRHL